MSKERDEFIKKYSQDVVDACEGTGIFPSLKMAQMIIESADKYGRPGQGITALKANNFFGIKANTAWTGDKMAFSTPKDGKPVNYFRVYPTAKDSVADHTLFLQENSRYEKNGVFSAKTPEDQAWCLQRAGYAEGNDGKGGGYADALITMIKAYNLKELDNKFSTKKKL
jgi:mannosyl-glycoprotein endo-beta-N-acetylglucosaminidase/stage II sporulation protein P